MRTDDCTGSTKLLLMGTADVLGSTVGEQQQEGVRRGVMRGGGIGGFGGLDSREEVIEFRSSVVRPSVDPIVLLAQAAGRAIV